MTNDRLRARRVVSVLALVAASRSLPFTDRPFKGLPLMSKRSEILSPCMPRRRSRTTLRGWSPAYTLTPIRVVPTVAF